MAPAHSTALRQLLRALGSAVVRTAEEELFAASFDNARLSFLPEAVVRPREESEVGQVLQLANRHEVPVTVRGGGTATTGAASPVRGGWVLDLSGWTRLRIDPAAGMAYAQPGVRVAALQAAAEKKGWLYPPDPSSHKYCTIGGAIACNAGGLRAAKYGVTRDYVLALEGFLPTGEWVRWGGDLKKFASGLNLRDLWIGSEGMLGVITGAVLKLVPRPSARRTALATFRDDASALRAVRALLGGGILPSILEFLDRQTVGSLIRYCAKRGRPLPAGLVDSPRALLLIELDGHPAEVAEQEIRLAELLAPRAEAWRQAADPAEAESLWAARRTCSQAMFELAPHKLNEDIVVPLRSQLALLRCTRRLARETGLATPTFGHAADGNFHVHLMYDRDQPEQLAAAERGVRELMRQVVELGGAITGEHGIGLAKSEFLALQHSPAEIRAMRAVKEALDPRGILNPGKMFEPFPVWRHRPVEVRMPWDH